MKLFVTGGSGFIGRNICEQLAGKYEIVAPSHSELDIIDSSAVDRFFADQQSDIVIHAAVKPGHRNAKDPTSLFYSNTRMYYNLARHSDKYEKMIILSSGAIYDTNQNLHKVSEDYYYNQLPKDEHGFCKYVCARDIENTDNITELRLFGVFGKYEDYAIRFISNAICKTLFDLPITIKQNRKFDYLYIDDLMPILEWFLQKEPTYKAYNVTPDHEVELYELAEMVIEISGKELPIIVHNEGLGLEYSGDNSRLKAELGELRFAPLKTAVEQLYQWYSDNRDKIGKDYLLVDK